MRFKGFVFLISVSCMLSVPIAGHAASQSLSLEDAIQRSLGINANLKQSEENLKVSSSQLRIAEITNAYGASLNSNLERTRQNTTLASQATGTLSLNTLEGTKTSLSFSPFGTGSERGTLSLSYRKPLMQGKGILSDKSNQVLGAKNDVLMQDKELYLKRQATVQSVIEAYYRAVAAREQLKIQEQAVSIAQEAADGARKRADAGLVAGIEVSRAEIQVAQTRDQLNLQQQTVRGSIDQLMLAIGGGVGETYDLSSDIPETPTEIISLSDAIQKALKNRGELAIYNARISNQERDLSRANDRLRPGLDLVAGVNSTMVNSGVVSGSFFGMDSIAGGVEYRIPLDKRIDKEERDTTERGLDILQKMRLYQVEQVTEDVRGAYRSVESAKTSLEILGQNLSEAQKNLQLAQLMVDEGLSSNRDVLDAQNSLTSVESGVLSAKVNLYLAHVNLLYAMGDDLTGIK